jgi:hypothetical protein
MQVDLEHDVRHSRYVTLLGGTDTISVERRTATLNTVGRNNTGQSRTTTTVHLCTDPATQGSVRVVGGPYSAFNGRVYVLDGLLTPRSLARRMATLNSTVARLLLTPRYTTPNALQMLAQVSLSTFPSIGGYDLRELMVEARC